MICHLGHYLGLVILDIIYDLSSWTFYMTCHPGHYNIIYDFYMTCHIGHYFGLVILDIIYDLSSWTLCISCHLVHMTYNLCKLSDMFVKL